MTGEERRKQILDTIRTAGHPVSGAELGRMTGVSRQVIVQDITVLRAEHCPILATRQGYIYSGPSQPCARRVLKTRHRPDQTEDEMNTVVDLGGIMEDVFINHRVYGKLSASLHARNRRDVREFMERMRTGRSSLLMNVTSGYHFHTISAESEEILDEIEEALREKGYLAEVLPYEKEMKTPE